MVVQTIICRIPGLEYSETIQDLLLLGWLIASLLLGYCAPNARMAFYCSVALAVPGLSYSMVGYGLLEMGGFLHALTLGSIGCLLYRTVQHCKKAGLR